ncbi:hypothetical protein V6N13_024641 [Hibiscus sabdariffa]
MLQKRIINFCSISAHRRESIAKALKKCIRDWGIERVFTIIVDNASSNGVAVVRYIGASPSRMKKFYNRAKEDMIDTNAHLCLDVPTRWNLTYTMLKVAEKYERAFDSYARDDHSCFLDITAGDGVHTFDDWENVRRIAKILEPFL